MTRSVTTVDRTGKRPAPDEGAVSKKRRSGQSSSSSDGPETGKPDTRRLSHNAVEKRRQQRIKEGIERLEKVLLRHNIKPKADKASILEAAANYMEEVQLRLKETLAKNAEIKSRLKDITPPMDDRGYFRPQAYDMKAEGVVHPGDVHLRSFRPGPLPGEYRTPLPYGRMMGPPKTNYEVIFEIKSDGTIGHVSADILGASGFSPAEMIGQPSLKFIHTDDMYKFASVRQRAMSRTREPITYRRLCSDGNYVLVTVHSIKDLNADTFEIIEHGFQPGLGQMNFVPRSRYEDVPHLDRHRLERIQPRRQQGGPPPRHPEVPRSRAGLTPVV